MRPPSIRYLRLRPGIRRLPLIACLIVALALAGLRAPAAYAASIRVTTTADTLQKDGKCSLREAIIAANTDKAVDTCAAGKGADTIVLPAGTYRLGIAGVEDAAAKGDLDITGSLTLKGSGAAATTIDGNRLDRVVDVLAGATVTIADVTIMNGQVFAGTSVGGGVSNQGTLTLSNSIVRGNLASEYGGGIWNGGKLTITNSTIRENSAENEDGGGIYNDGTLTMSNSTIRNNAAHIEGAGLYNDGTATVTASTFSDNEGDGIATSGTLSLTNTTFGDDGIFVWSGRASIASSTLDWLSAYDLPQPAVNVRNSIVRGCAEGTKLTSQGYNLIQNPSGCTIVGDTTGNRLNVDPRLGPLQDNGGPTFTRALLSGSPAIDAGTPATPGSAATACPATDQRGVVRAQDGNGDGSSRCDIGAYELLAPNLLKNGGFELDANANGRPDSWSSNSHFTRSGASVQSGRYAGRHRATDNAAYTISQSVAGVRAGRAYVFSGYLNAPPSTDSFTFKLQLRWRTASGTSIRTDTLKSVTDDTKGAWVRVWASKVVPSGTSSVQVVMVVSSLKASIYVDSFALRLAPTTASTAMSEAEMPDFFGDDALGQVPAAAPAPADATEEAEPAD